jgi:hypothetical protein
MVNTSPLPSSKSSAVLRDVRSTHFFDTSSIDSEGSTPTPLQPSQPQSNGNDKASSSKRKPSHQLNGGPKKRSARVEDSEEARSRRREIADKLFEGRQELPFYQGVLASAGAQIGAEETLCRKKDDHGGDHGA